MLVVQAAISLIIVTGVFEIEIKGSVWLAVTLPILMGLSGLSMGKIQTLGQVNYISLIYVMHVYTD
jgi:uncharacterized membrane protein